MIKVTLGQLQPILLRLLKAKIVPYLHGKPGIGKSALTHYLADMLSLKLIDIRLTDYEPTDLSGFPYIDKETMTATHVPFNTFPTETTPIPDGYNGWLILFDELPAAAPAVQAAAYKILLDRKVGQHKLHSRVLMMAAGNMIGDGAIAHAQSSAITSRTANYEVLPSQPEWCEWATSKQYDHRITSYLQFKPEMIHTLNPDAPEEPYACSRTWEFTNSCTKDQPVKSADVPLLAGLIGEGVAREFQMFCDIYQDLPTMAQICANPKHIRLSDRLDIKWALMGSLCQHVTESTLEPVTTFLDRFPAELRVVAMRDMFTRHPELYDLEASQDWLNRTAAEVF